MIRTNIKLVKDVQIQPGEYIDMRIGASVADVDGNPHEYAVDDITVSGVRFFRPAGVLPNNAIKGSDGAYYIRYYLSGMPTTTGPIVLTVHNVMSDPADPQTTTCTVGDILVKASNLVSVVTTNVDTQGKTLAGGWTELHNDGDIIVRQTPPNIDLEFSDVLVDNGQQAYPLTVYVGSLPLINIVNRYKSSNTSGDAGGGAGSTSHYVHIVVSYVDGRSGKAVRSPEQYVKTLGTAFALDVPLSCEVQDCITIYNGVPPIIDGCKKYLAFSYAVSKDNTFRSNTNKLRISSVEKSLDIVCYYNRSDVLLSKAISLRMGG